jgi:hypothetical protein
LAPVAVVAVIALAACSAYAPVSAPSQVQQPSLIPPTPVDYAPPIERRKPATDIFVDIARDLLGTLDPGKRIALQPFRAVDIPIALPVAQGFNAALARAIETAPDAPGTIVAREELPRLFAEAEEFGAAKDAQKLLEAAHADILVIGTLIPAPGGVEISYKAFDARTGQQLASAAPRFQRVDVAAPRGMPLDQAVAAAAEALAHQAPEMRTVETLGIYYQQSEVQTALGGYIGRALVGQLAEKINGLQASPAALLRPEFQTIDTLAAGGAEDVMVRAKPGVFLLSGTLWDLGTDVEVRLSLRGAADRVASTGVRIRRDAIPASFLPLAPAGLPAGGQSARRDGAGPFALQLSSDRGRRPVYAAGDSAHLLIQAVRDGYLYCFHQSSANAGGGITRIFPNPYHPDAHIRGQASVHIPDDGMNFALKVYGPAGVEQVRCFVLDRDAEGAVPAGVFGRGLEPISANSLDDVGQILRAVPSAAVSEATLVMTIEPRRTAAAGTLK